MTVLIYLASVLLECYSKSRDVIIKAKVAIAKAVARRYFVKRCSERSCKIHRKTPVLEFHSNKVAGLQLATLLSKGHSVGR